MRRCGTSAFNAATSRNKRTAKRSDTMDESALFNSLLYTLSFFCICYYYYKKKMDESAECFNKALRDHSANERRLRRKNDHDNNIYRL